MIEAIILTAITVLLLFIDGFEVSFHPFRVSMDGWRDLVATIFLFVGIMFYGSVRHTEGYAKGRKEGAKEIIRLLEEIVNEHNNIIKTKEEQYGKEDWRSI